MGEKISPSLPSNRSTCHNVVNIPVLHHHVGVHKVNTSAKTNVSRSETDDSLNISNCIDRFFPIQHSVPFVHFPHIYGGSLYAVALFLLSHSFLMQ